MSARFPQLSDAQWRTFVADAAEALELREDERVFEVQCGAGVGPNNFKCYCWKTTEGTNVCTREAFDTPDCRTSADCPNGSVCIQSGIVTGGAHSCEVVCS